MSKKLCSRAYSSKSKLRRGRILASTALTFSISPGLLHGALAQGLSASNQAFTTQIEFPVSFPAVGLNSLLEWGSLSSPGPTQGRALLVLVSGGTYDHDYWDMPGVVKRYSFVRAANEAGFATLNLDRPGLGNSSKPPADTLTVPNEAVTIHQIIQDIRKGDLARLGFGKIILIGHSAGSIIAEYEASSYDDVDGLVLTGFSNLPITTETADLQEFSAHQVEASTVPALAGEDPPPGYITSQTGFRSLFYNSTDADPEVIAQDDATRSTATEVEDMSEGTVIAVPATAAAVKAPVLTLFGAQDNILIDPRDARTIAETEFTHFVGAPSHQTVVVPLSGHSVQLALNVQYTDGVILDWIKRIVLFGPVGGDLVQGGPGNATLAGGSTGDIVVGNGGNNTIIANGGNNLLVGGGGGSNQFIPGLSGGRDVITDFNGNQGDRLILDPSLSFSVSALGTATIVALSNGGSLTLLNVQAAGFQPSWVERQAYPAPVGSGPS